MKKIHYKSSAENIQKYNWNKWLEQNKDLDINSTYDSFNEAIQSCITLVNKGKQKEKIQMPYITKNVTNLRIQTDKARKKFLNKKTDSTEKAYKKLNKEYTYALRKAKDDYYGMQLKNCKNDTKKTWTVINSILNRKNKNNKMTSIMHNDQEINDPKEIANLLNSYYRDAAINKITKTENKDSFKEFLSNNDITPNSFSLKKIYPEDTWSYIKSIAPKSSSGTDNIPSKLIHMSATHLLQPLTLIINKDKSI